MICANEIFLYDAKKIESDKYVNAIHSMQCVIQIKDIKYQY